MLRRQFGGGALGPFDDEDAARRELFERELRDLLRIFQTVEVGVEEAQRRVIDITPMMAEDADTSV